MTEQSVNFNPALALFSTCIIHVITYKHSNHHSLNVNPPDQPIVLTNYLINKFTDSFTFFVDYHVSLSNGQIYPFFENTWENITLNSSVFDENAFLFDAPHPPNLLCYLRLYFFQSKFEMDYFNGSIKHYMNLFNNVDVVFPRITDDNGWSNSYDVYAFYSASSGKLGILYPSTYYIPKFNAYEITAVSRTNTDTYLKASKDYNIYSDVSPYSYLISNNVPFRILFNVDDIVLYYHSVAGHNLKISWKPFLQCQIFQKFLSF